MFSRSRFVAVFAVLVAWGVTAVVLGIVELIGPLASGLQAAAAVLALLLLPSARAALRTLRGVASRLEQIRGDVRGFSKEMAASRRQLGRHMKESNHRQAELVKYLKRLDVAMSNSVAVKASGEEARKLAGSVNAAEGTYASRRLNALLSALPARASYLEIGLDRGLTFEAVRAAERWGVDPRPRVSLTAIPAGDTIVVAPSDRFFELLAPQVRFDLVYLDGLHTYTQTYRDLMHALAHTHPRGVILIDDVVPSDDVSAIPDYQTSLTERAQRGMDGRVWHGDVFRLVKILHDHHPELSYCTIVGADNEQTLVWRAEPSRTCVPVTDEVVASFSRLSYAEVFNDGIPEYFNPCSEPEALSRFIRAMTYR